jgi:hypothetical protein
MAIRFRKSFKLAPGVRMNLSGGGMSWSVGPRGASVGIGKRGTYLNTGIPGTGLSARQKIGGAQSSASSRSSNEKVAFAISISVSDDGTIAFKDNNGNPLPEKLITMAKKQQGDAIRNLIQGKCDEINQAIDSVGELHFSTPSPKEKPRFVAGIFHKVPPELPTQKRLGFIRSLFKKHRERAEAEYTSALAEHEEALKKWELQRAAFNKSQNDRRQLIESHIYSDQKAMEQFLEETLQDIVWPRETDVSTEISDNGHVIFIDADFPEIEDMPTNKASVPAKGYKLSVKELSATQVQKLYMQHVHGIAFRTIGEAFSALPNSRVIVFSGYSQRADKATAKIADEYLLSVRVERSDWEKIDFNNLASLDVVEALSRFELRRTMTKTGVFTAIIPFSP